MDIKIFQADYSNPHQAKDIGELLHQYALDPMGGGQGLTEDIKSSIAAELDRISKAFTILCYVDEQPAGLINCLQGFSTFKCKPLINIHDIAVAPKYRGLEICRKMLEQVEAIANERGCCKLTLEVLEGNSSAQRAYQKFGFDGYELDPKMGKALFWEKNLN